MKGIGIAVIVAVLYVVISVVSCCAQGYDHWYTDGELNGNFVLETNDSDKINYYLEGVMDCLEKYDKGVISTYYEGYKLGNYYDAVVGYYSKYPDQREVSILTILLKGLKPPPAKVS